MRIVQQCCAAGKAMADFVGAAGTEGSGAGRPAEDPPTYAASSKASSSVSDLMQQDAEDESLARYKEKLLGSAASGDLGKVDDPRRVVVTEFKVVFEDPGKSDFVCAFEKLKDTPFKLQQGCKYRFQIEFRVQHEIVSGLRFVNEVKRMLFSQTEELTLGSFAPASEPHSFVSPRRGWEEAPSGMMARGEQVGFVQSILCPATHSSLVPTFLC